MTEGSQEFCLRWNNHQATIISVFDYLLENETLVDCTLAAEGQYLKAHKVVLCACSPYLELLLSQHNDKHPILIFKDIKFTELKSMIEYMYKGEVNIAQDQLNHFLKAAESLQIKGLSESEEESTPTAAPTPRPPPPRAPPVQRTQPRPISNTVAIADPHPESPKRINRNEAASPSRKRRRQVLPIQGRPSLSGDDASNASEGHLDQSNCDVPSTPLQPSSENSVAKVESNSELMLEPKTEYDDNSVEDITLDDDEEDYSQAGTSMDNSQMNFSGWQQMVGDKTGDDVFAGQDSGAQNSQDFAFSHKIVTLNRLLPKYRQLNQQIVPVLIDNIKRGVKMLIVMRGLPGSGKSTRIQNLIKEMRDQLENPAFNPKIFSADDYFMTSQGYIFDKTKLGQAHICCYNSAQGCLLNYESPVFIDNTNVNKKDLKKYYDLSYYNWYKFYVLEPETEWAFNVEALLKKNIHHVKMMGLINMVKKYYIPQGMESVETYEDDSSFYFTGVNNSSNQSSPKASQSEKYHSGPRYRESRPSCNSIEYDRDRTRNARYEKHYFNKRQEYSKENEPDFWEYSRFQSNSPKERIPQNYARKLPKNTNYGSCKLDNEQNSRDNSVPKEGNVWQFDTSETTSSSNPTKQQNESIDDVLGKYTLVNDEKVKERLKKQLSFFFRRKQEPKSSSSKLGRDHDEMVHKYFNRSSSESSDETSDEGKNSKESKPSDEQQETTVRHGGDKAKKAFDAAEKKTKNIQIKLGDTKSVDHVDATNISFQTTNDTIASVTDISKPVSNVQTLHQSEIIKDSNTEASSNVCQISKENSISGKRRTEEYSTSGQDMDHHERKALNDETSIADQDEQISDTEDGEVLSDAEDKMIDDKNNKEDNAQENKTEEPAESEEEMEEGEIVDNDSDGSIQEIADDDDIEMVFAAEKKPDPKRDVEKNRLRRQLMAIEEKIQAARRAKKKRRRSSSSSSSGSSASNRSRSSSSSSSSSRSSSSS